MYIQKVDPIDMFGKQRVLKPIAESSLENLKPV